MLVKQTMRITEEIIFYNIYLACKSLIQLDVEDQVTSSKYS